jgi:hypothetical protein
VPLCLYDSSCPVHSGWGSRKALAASQLWAGCLRCAVAVVSAGCTQYLSSPPFDTCTARQYLLHSSVHASMISTTDTVSRNGNRLYEDTQRILLAVAGLQAACCADDHAAADPSHHCSRVSTTAVALDRCLHHCCF